MSDLDEQNQKKIQTAITLHQAGQIDQAEVLYLQLLNKGLVDSILLTNLGTIALQKNNFEQGIEILKKSLDYHPNQPQSLNNLGYALKNTNRQQEALTYFNQAIDLQPDYTEAYLNRGNTLQDLNRFSEALADFDQVIRINPHHADAYSNRGNVLQDLDRLEEALLSFNQAISIQPEQPNSYFNRGQTLARLGRYSAALADLNKALEINPDWSEAYLIRGKILTDLKDFEAAIDDYDRAVQLNPKLAKAYFNRANTLKSQKRLAQALIDYHKAIELEPDNAEIYANQASALHDLEQWDNALIHYDKAISLDPNYAMAYLNRGNVLKDLNRLDAALASYHQVININPDCSKAYVNQGVVLETIGDLEAAIDSYDKAIELDVDNADAYWNKSFAKIMQGKLEEGWQLYEWRWQSEQFNVQRRDFRQPVWLGDVSLTGKTLLIHPEQGLGDFLQFIRYVTLFDTTSTQLIIETYPSLTAIISTLKGQYTLIENGQPLPDFDYHCPIMSLPLAFKTTLKTIPAPIPYLFAEPEKKSFWQQQFANNDRFRVGLVWSGACHHSNDKNRSIPVKELSPLLDLPIEFHALQNEIRATDQDFLTSNKIICHQQQLVDFSDTAGLIEAMDLVISVDTSVAHLTGALGQKLWLLLPFNADCRWFRQGSDTPWYPEATLFRQEDRFNWKKVIQIVKKQLDRLVQEMNSSPVIKQNIAVSADLEKQMRQAIACHQSGQLVQAEQLYRKLLPTLPDNTSLLTNLATLVLQKGETEEGIQLLKTSLKQNPQQPYTLNNLGYALKNLNRQEEALPYFDRAIRINPNYAEAYSNRGNTYQDLKQFQSALDDFDRAIAINPDYAAAYSNRGIVLQALERFDEAAISYNRAIALNPQSAEAYLNRGKLFKNLGQLHKGLSDYELAIEIDPENAQAHWNKACAKLLNGEYEEGWRLYEWRWQKAKHQPEQPHWLGQDSLAGKVLLIYPEQGYGDFIQCIRYALEAQKLARQVIIETHKALLKIMASLKGNFTLIEKGQARPEFIDLYCPVMSLPLAFKTSVNSIPNRTPYLFANPDKQRLWQQRLGQRKRFRVGLVWSGSKQHENDRYRSIPIDRFKPLLDLAIDFHLLQKDITTDDLIFLKKYSSIQTYHEQLQDFSDTAALIAEMDLVISVDTSVAHLAGALAKPLWLLLPFDPDYRWLLNRTDSPWYPSATLFRQTQFNDWAGVIDQIKMKLQFLSFNTPYSSQQKSVSSQYHSINLPTRTHRTTPFQIVSSNHGMFIALCFNSQDDGINPFLMTKIDLNEAELELTLDLLRLRRKYYGSGVVAIDCGAQIGTYSIEWGKLMSQWGRVYALETDERLFYALAGNIALNNCFNITANWADKNERNSNSNVFQAKVDSLNLQRLDLIKITVDLSDLSLLDSISSVINRFHPIMLISLKITERDGLQTLLEQSGYHIFPLESGWLTFHNDDLSLQSVIVSQGVLSLNR